MLAVIDIDGVVADVRHRLHHVTGGSHRWGAFFRAAGGDALLAEGAEVVRRLAEVYEIAYVSGRPEHLRAVTEAWLAEHDLPAGTVTLRPADDFRPGSRYKVDVLRRLARTHTVVVLVDDDPRVLDAARSDGFDVLPATWMGEHSSTVALAALRDAQERDGRT